jgi:hypothetical protein
MLRARTVAEAHLYMDLRGAEPGPRGHRLEARGDALVSVYQARCEGTPQRFEFVIDEPEARHGLYGDEVASSIVGPGEFLAWSDLLSRAVPAEVDGLDRASRAEARRRMALAVACVEEILKFVPAGGDQVPEAAFRSDLDLAVRAAEPGRFRRERLEAVLTAWRRLMDGWEV